MSTRLATLALVIACSSFVISIIGREHSHPVSELPLPFVFADGVLALNVPLVVKDGSGVERIRLSVREDKCAEFSICSQEDKSRITLLVEPGGKPLISLIDPYGATRAGIGLGLTGAPGAAMHHRNGNPAAFVGVDLGGSVEIHVLTDDGHRLWMARKP